MNGPRERSQGAGGRRGTAHAAAADAGRAVPTVPAAARSPGRMARLDAWRGAAMVWMALFHLCYDLNHFGLWQPRQLFLSDPFWTVQRAAIVTLFLACVGVSQAAARAQAQPAVRFWRRWSQVAGAALLVSVGSAWMFPRTWIWFGVLHAIAVILLLLRLLPARPPLRAALAVLALALPWLLQLRAFDVPVLQWLGLGTRAPVTEDWVPLLPWIGVVLVGWVVGDAVLRRAPGLLARPLPPPLRPLAALGRWPLTFYLLHQPVLIGVLTAGRSAGWW